MIWLGRPLFHKLDGFIGYVISSTQLFDSVYCRVRTNNGGWKGVMVPNDTTDYYVGE